MTPEQIQLVEDTASTLDLTALAADFYARAFERDPALSEMFTSDPVVQQGRLGAELGEIVASIRHLDRFGPTVQALGARHRDYGVRVAHYRLMGDVLMESLAGALASRWTPDVTVAWRMAYALTVETMLAGALEEAPRRSPRNGSDAAAAAVARVSAIRADGSGGGAGHRGPSAAEPA
jgi:hemoglobin-like flavoprotein